MDLKKCISMKKILYILIAVLFYSCSSSFVGKKFTMISTDNEWEIELVLNRDSTFTLIDKYGCVRMAQKGKWKVINNTDTIFDILFLKTIVLTDTLQAEKWVNRFGHRMISYHSNLNGLYYHNRESEQFPLVTNDTLFLVAKNKALFKTFTFDIYNGNLQKKRVLAVEKFYIDRTGKLLYIKLLGEGISIEKARENIIKCQREN